MQTTTPNAAAGSLPACARIGVDARKFPGGLRQPPLTTLRRAHDAGFDGVFFRSILDLSTTLDPGELREIRQAADDLGMYLETGLGNVNPYALPETPRLRAVGDGDTLLGFRRMMQACAAIGCRELWAATANYQLNYPGRFAWDRFRTDVTWRDQLDAVVGFLRQLRPVALDLGVHINLETHEEITSVELVEIVTAVGPDVCGILYDTANLLQRLEHPVRTAERIAPYVRQTQLKDATLLARPDGYEFALVSVCGEGIVDFAAVLGALAAACPVALNLTIEARECVDDYPGPAPTIVLPLADPVFVGSHEHLTTAELAEFVALTLRDSAEPGDRAGFDTAAATAALSRSRDHLRDVQATLPAIGGVR